MEMTSEDHAKIWRQAARVVAGMDPRMAQMQQALANMRDTGSQSGTLPGMSYSSTEGAAWDAYSAAANVLSQIAAEYEARK